MKPAGHLCERVPQLTGFPLSQANKMDYPVNPPLLSDDDLKDSNGRIHIILSKSAQKKIHQKRMRELALLRREREKEREKSLHLTRHSGDPEDATKESFVLPPINGTVSVSHNMSNIRRERAGTALRKRVNRPSLPSIPIIS
ncbi:Protein FAM179A, partial [Phalacrocorax carbo]